MSLVSADKWAAMLLALADQDLKSGPRDRRMAPRCRSSLGTSTRPCVMRTKRRSRTLACARAATPRSANRCRGIAGNASSPPRRARSRVEARTSRQADRTSMQFLGFDLDVTAFDSQAPVSTQRRSHLAHLRHQRPPRRFIGLHRTRHFGRADRRVRRAPRQLAHDLLRDVFVAHAAVVCRTARSQFTINSAARSRGIVGRKRRSTCHCAASSSRFL